MYIYSIYIDSNRILYQKRMNYDELLEKNPQLKTWTVIIKEKTIMSEKIKNLRNEWANGLTKGEKSRLSRYMTVRLHCVESFEGLLQRCLLRLYGQKTSKSIFETLCSFFSNLVI